MLHEGMILVWFMKPDLQRAKYSVKPLQLTVWHKPVGYVSIKTSSRYRSISDRRRPSDLSRSHVTIVRSWSGSQSDFILTPNTGVTQISSPSFCFSIRQTSKRVQCQFRGTHPSSVVLQAATCSQLWRKRHIKTSASLEELRCVWLYVFKDLPAALMSGVPHSRNARNISHPRQVMCVNAR